MEKETKVKEAKIKEATTIDITCVDCGTTRTINKGEAFQVKRCVECQDTYRKASRKAYRKNRVANLRQQVERLKEHLKNLAHLTDEEIAKLI